jgi:hypothetical protein
MLKKFINSLSEAAGQLADWFQDFVADYAGELLAAHGLIEVEVDQIRKRREEEKGVTGDSRPNVVWPDDPGQTNDARLVNGYTGVPAPEAKSIANRVRIGNGIETLVTVALATCAVLALTICLVAFVSR